MKKKKARAEDRPKHWIPKRRELVWIIDKGFMRMPFGAHLLEYTSFLHWGCFKTQMEAVEFYQAAVVMARYHKDYNYKGIPWSRQTILNQKSKSANPDRFYPWVKNPREGF